MNQLKKNFEKILVVESTTENLSKVREFTKNAAVECKFSEDTIEKIVLAVDEACTNIIKHAYNYSPDGIINISIKVNNGKFIVTIIDHGKTFNPDTIPEPDVREYYKQKKVGGLGMYLMKKLMDEVIYSTLGDNKNQVVLVKSLEN
ncbi:ATP-binding protein [Rosettibacter firmus]|uniref:ATP-binding protein n=1 Tax=Rosettibacter firmus TaxID=3111522 RepID=UPI00336C1E4D